MRIKMLKDAPGSPDGVDVNNYEKGHEYEVSGELGAVFLDQGLAERVKGATKPADEGRVIDVDVNDPARGGYGITDPGSAENQELRRVEDERAIAEAEEGRKQTAPRENK